MVLSPIIGPSKAQTNDLLGGVPSYSAEVRAALKEQSARHELLLEQFNKKAKSELASLRAELNPNRVRWVTKALVHQVVVCPLCDEKDLYFIPYPSAAKRFLDLTVIACGGCGLSWVPQGDLDLEEYYRNSYADEDRRDRHLEPLEYFRQLEAGEGLRWYYDRAKRHCGYLDCSPQPPRRILDLGAGPGYFIHALRSRYDSIDVSYAIEADKASKKYLDHLGVRLIKQDELADHMELDVVCASHSLEHFWFDDVRRLLTNVADSLRPRGLFIFEVPLASLLRHTIPHQHAPHTLFFSYEALELIVRKAGFQSVVLFPSHPKGAMAVRADAAYAPTKWSRYDGRGSIVGIATKVPNDVRLAFPFQE